jgi:hypothetical protein
MSRTFLQATSTTKRLPQGQIGRRYFADGYLPKANLIRERRL